MRSTIRKVNYADVDALREVIESNQLFPSELLLSMSKDYFNNKAPKEIWLTKDEDSVPIALVYCAPEEMTEGTYNLYLIAVHKNYHGKGIGSEMISYLEELLCEQGARILIVETSALPEFTLTRAFYDKLHFEKEAVIRDFYQEGEDKVVFWKKLSS
ncbi:MAG: GNAT family N-acetyltransferase [Bacteroidota bacterium]